MKNSIPGLRLAVSVVTVLTLAVIVLVLSLPKQKAQSKADLSATFERFAVGDEITRAIRLGSKAFARVEVANDADRREAAKYGRIVNDYRSFVVVVKERASDLERSGLESQPIETTVNLPGAKFDP